MELVHFQITFSNFIYCHNDRASIVKALGVANESTVDERNIAAIESDVTMARAVFSRWGSRSQRLLTGESRNM